MEAIEFTFKGKQGSDRTATIDPDNGTLILGTGKVRTKVNLQALDRFLSLDDPRECAEAINTLAISTLQLASLLVNEEQGDLSGGILPDQEAIARLTYITEFLRKIVTE